MLWQKLENAESLERVIAQSYEKPIILFKHSTRCSISSTAKNRLERVWKDNPPCPVFLIDVLQSRPISNEIAEKFNIPHQSPQVLVIREGECIYSASHFGIMPEEIMEQLTG